MISFAVTKSRFSHDAAQFQSECSIFLCFYNSLLLLSDCENRRSYGPLQGFYTELGPTRALEYHCILSLKVYTIHICSLSCCLRKLARSERGHKVSDQVSHKLGLTATEETRG